MDRQQRAKSSVSILTYLLARTDLRYPHNGGILEIWISLAGYVATPFLTLGEEGGLYIAHTNVVEKGNGEIIGSGIRL